jgi:hypothetical protein
MHRSILVIVALMLLLRPGLSQERPIEIDLVPPTSRVGGVEFPRSAVLSGASLPEPKWRPPARPCQVCSELPKGERCRCDDLLTQDMARGILRQVRRAIESSTAGNIALSRPIQVRVVSRSRLAQMGGEKLLGLYEDDVIWVNHELTRRQATGVIAHEYGHAWFFQKRLDVNTPNELLFEGFAEFVSFLALRELGDKIGANNIEFQDQSVYGRGARKLIALYRRSGVAAVVSLALTGTRV